MLNILCPAACHWDIEIRSFHQWYSHTTSLGIISVSINDLNYKYLLGSLQLDVCEEEKDHQKDINAVLGFKSSVHQEILAFATTNVYGDVAGGSTRFLYFPST